MRRRLLVALLLFAALAVNALAVPLAASVSTSRTQQLWLSRYVYAGWFAELAKDAFATGNRKTLVEEMERYRTLYGESVLVVDAGGAEYANSGIDTRDATVLDTLTAARSNRQVAQPPHRLRTWDPDTMMVGAPVGSGIHVDGAVVIEASTVRAKAEIADYWALIAVGASTALAVFTGLALALSRWVLRPLAQLSRSLATLTETLPKPVPSDDPPSAITRHYGGPPEVRELAQSFDAMATAVSDSVQSQRQLVADTAHAIRNPLAALAIRLQALERVIPEQAQTSFRRASSQVDRLTAILDGLLKLAVAETPVGFDPAQSDSYWPDRCNVVPVVADRVDEWQVAFEQARMTLSTGPSEPVVEAAVPADAFEQILDIALSNSCRYAGAGANTEVRIQGGRKWVTVSVIDNGVGVSADELDKLTTRFYRGVTAAAGGSGLGLPIALALAQRFQGEILIGSTDPHGLHVAVRLPVVKK